MISQEQQSAIKNAIQSSTTEKYLAAYCAALGSKISLGEDKARHFARAAGCAAIKYADEDITLDNPTFSSVCQAEYERVMFHICSSIETQPAGLILPAHMATN